MKKAVALVVVAAVAYAGTQHGVPATTTATTGTGTVSGGTLSCTGLESLWESAGGSPGAAFMAAEIATAESSGQQYSTNHNTNGTVDRGYFQINSTWGTLSTYDPAGNARAAIQISHDGSDWTPWMTYDSGVYQGKC